MSSTRRVGSVEEQSVDAASSPEPISDRLVVALALLALCLIWGSTYLAIRVAIEGFPFLLRRVRLALATSCAYVNPVVAVILGVDLAGELIKRQKDRHGEENEEVPERDFVPPVSHRGSKACAQPGGKGNTRRLLDLSWTAKGHIVFPSGFMLVVPWST